MAYDILDPALRSRGGVTSRAKELYRDDDFFDASAERGYRFEPSVEITPEKLFEKRWATTVLQRALSRLQDQFAREENPCRYQSDSCQQKQASPGGRIGDSLGGIHDPSGGHCGPGSALCAR